MILTSCIPALGMLTSPLVSLSKPVGPMEPNRRTYRTRIGSISMNLSLFLRAFPRPSSSSSGSGFWPYTVLAAIPNAPLCPVALAKGHLYLFSPLLPVAFNKMALVPHFSKIAPLCSEASAKLHPRAP